MLLGVFEPGADPKTLAPIAARMLARSSTAGRPVRTEQRRGLVFFVAAEAEGAPIANDGALCCAVSGQLDLPESLGRWLRGQDAPNAETVSGRILEALRLRFERDVDSLPRLSGTCSLLFHDQARDRLILIADRFGRRPLFVAEEGPRLFFAEDLAALAGGLGRVALDETTLVESFASFELFSSRTWLAGVRDLSPGHWLEQSPARQVVARYERTVFREGAADQAIGVYVENLARALRSGAARDHRDAAVLAEGRAGSTLLALATNRLFAPLRLVSFGFEDVSTPYADQLADALSADLRNFVVDLDWVLREARRRIERVFGPRGEHRGRWSLVIDRIAAQGEGLVLPRRIPELTAWPLLRGFTRELVHPFGATSLLSAPEQFARTRATRVEAWLHGLFVISRGTLEQVFRPERLAKLWPEVFERARRELDGHDADEPSCHRAQIELTQLLPRRARLSLPPNVDVRTPFLRPGALEALARMPPEWRRDGRVLDALLEISFPEGRRIKGCFDDLPRSVSGPRSWIPRRRPETVHDDLGRVLGQPLISPAYRHALEADHALLEDVRRFTQADYFPGALLAAESIRALVDRVQRGDAPSEMHLVTLHLAVFARCFSWYSGASPFPLTARDDYFAP